MRPKLEDILQKMDYNIYKLSESNNFLLIKSIISLADILHLSILSNPKIRKQSQWQSQLQ